MQRTKPFAVFCLALAFAGTAVAQRVTVPRASQHAVLSQTVGLTEITVDYHRPIVKERTIWGALVPYGQVWRAGANENTTVTFSDDVKVEGQELPAGTYGLHMIPTEEKWTVIFSKNHTSWGSFSYNQEEDALRVEVTPAGAPHREALTYDLVDLKADAATLALWWEKKWVPVKIEVATNDVVLASIRNELRSLPGFSWQGLSSAAGWCLNNDVNFEEALQWSDRSIQAERRFENLQTKSQLLAKLERGDEAKELMAEAQEIANPLQLHNYARSFITQGEPQKALEIFQMNAKKHPDTWFINIGLARGYSAVGELTKAAEHMRLGAQKAPENQRAAYEGMAKQLDEGKAL